jgi:hypothetical protein
VGIFQNWFKSTPPSQPAANPAFDKLVAVYEERITELKTVIAEQKTQIADRDAKIFDLRKRVEMVPRMTVSQEIHDWSPESINDQPSFSAEADLKEMQEEIKRGLAALSEEHLTTVKQPPAVPVEA